MISLSTYLTFLGFWGCYQTSTKADLAPPNKLEQFVRSDARVGNVIGLGFLLIGLVGFVLVFGLGSGLFAYLVLLSSVGSLVILLAPMGYISLRSASMVCTVSFLLEMLANAR
ncbi:hypothetical protein [Marinoscillum sp.]|uniref:hypothetical protein n=1 Tax=Marinoscillum sp. TaxID=2024838 RepID=UPI003BABA388